MLINKENSIAVCIDIQEKLFPFMQDSLELQTRSAKLIQGLKVLNVPVLVTEQYPKGVGQTINPLNKVLGEEYKPIEKDSMSCCGNNEFNQKLKASGAKSVILIGIEAHICVMQTANELIDKGYNVYVVEDCTSSRNINDKNTAIHRIRQDGAKITTYESLLMELTKVSGTEEFKQISKIIK